jgi:hypothetical protein
MVETFLSQHDGHGLIEIIPDPPPAPAMAPGP